MRPGRRRGRGRRLPATASAAAASSQSRSSSTPDARDTTNSRRPPRSSATTGVPQARDSAATRPYGSSHSGVTSMAALVPDEGDEGVGVEVADVVDVVARAQPATCRVEVGRVADRTGDAQPSTGRPRHGDGPVRCLLRHEPAHPDEVVATGSGDPSVGRRRRCGRRAPAVTCDHDRAVCSLTATKWLWRKGFGDRRPISMAGSSHGVGGRVQGREHGDGSESAMATGRWWRLLLCTTATSGRRWSASMTCR